MKVTKKIVLQEQDMPTQWYNIVADMTTKPAPMINPETHQPLRQDEMSTLFAEELVKQEFSTERFIDIPDEVRDLYRIWRPTPLVRASGLEKALDTPAKIYFKNESISPVGSHKLNSAIPQAYYNKKQGIKHMTTETGAGQWGSSLAIACKHFGLDLTVFMVNSSYEQKPYRKSVMHTYGANVIPSPSLQTEVGKQLRERYPNTPGSLGMAISEAVELARKQPDTRYGLGSTMSHVCLHQTIIGEEARKQMEIVGDYPDVVIACFGGGSNFAGISFPFMRDNLTKGYKTRFIAAEPEACPKLTKGRFEYDFGDSIRSGASTAAEDERNLDLVQIDLARFRIYTRGFLRSFRKLTQKEIELLPLGAKVITFENGLRFLTDYIDGDHYFAISRDTQNLDRTRAQFKLVSDMESKWEEMQRIVAEEKAALL